MAQQKGATASIMLGFESTFGTAATAGFILPVNYGENLVGTQNINSRNTIRGNRNPNQGFRGNRQVGGTIVVPVDSVALPYWLTLLFGDPTSSGGPNYIHEWKIANTQPSGTIEKAFTDLTTARYNRFLGCKINGFTIDFGGDMSHFGGDRELCLDFLRAARDGAPSRSPIEAGILSALTCLWARESAQSRRYCDIVMPEPTA